MKEVHIDLKNCYWIKSLKQTFDFSVKSTRWIKNTVSIYAPNWTMKTSLSKTFDDYSKWKRPEDKINKIPWDCSLLDENWNPIDPNIILSIWAIDFSFEPQEMSLLLVNHTDKKEYDVIMTDIIKKRDAIIKKLAQLSWLKKVDVIDNIYKDYNIDKKTDFILFLKDKVEKISLDRDLSDIEYNILFWDAKVEDILKNPDFIKTIEEYEKEYDSIMKDYKFYSKGAFTPYKANNLLKSIKEQNLYWVDKNGVILAEKLYYDITDLQNDIDKSFENLEKNDKLKDLKEKIVKWTVAVRAFHDLIEKNWDKIIKELWNLNDLKINLWKSYFVNIKDEIFELVSLYETSLPELERIRKNALLEKTKWFKIAAIFEARFDVPFKISIEDEINVILWWKDPTIVFKYFNETTWIYDLLYWKDELLWLNVLSWWEKRALYLLYVLFDIETKKEMWAETLLIIDDIADSFDYKNKYAIIEYLLEISENENFKMIILSHNFDFHRSIFHRLDVWPVYNFRVLCKDRDISLIKWDELLDPVANFKNECWRDDFKLVALIPFAREIIKYIYWTHDQISLDDDWNTEFDEDWNERKYNYYFDLTCCVHSKTKKLTLWKLYEIFALIFNLWDTFEHSYDQSWNTDDLIITLCDKILIEWYTEELNLEKKIVLSLWIRLKSEYYMQWKIWKLEDKNRNQTRELYNECKNSLSDEENEIIKDVLLMTPESIHINSFMFEPIIDMSSKCLVDLYSKAKTLTI